MNFQRITLHDIPPLDLPAYLVLTNAQELAATYGREVTTKLSLDDKILVAVHRGLCRTGGYSIRIENVELENREVKVQLSLQDPRPGDFVTMVMTHPRDMILIKKNALPGPGEVTFHFVAPGGIVVAQQRVKI